MSWGLWFIWEYWRIVNWGHIFLKIYENMKLNVLGLISSIKNETVGTASLGLTWPANKEKVVDGLWSWVIADGNCTSASLRCVNFDVKNGPIYTICKPKFTHVMHKWVQTKALMRVTCNIHISKMRANNQPLGDKDASACVRLSPPCSRGKNNWTFMLDFISK